MTYLTYTEYKEIGGSIDETAFIRNIDRVCGAIDRATFGRIGKMATVPQAVKLLCRDLVEYFAKFVSADVVVSSRSQSAGGVSESESYVPKTKAETQSEIDEIIADYLSDEVDDNGTHLLYRGCIR